MLASLQACSDGSHPVDGDGAAAVTGNVARGTASNTESDTHQLVISVTPVSATAQVGQTQKFTARVTNDHLNKGVTWQVNSVAGGDPVHGIISPAGLYVAPAAVPSPAEVDITAISVADSTKTATVTIALQAAPIAASPAAPSKPAAPVATPAAPSKPAAPVAMPAASSKPAAPAAIPAASSAPAAPPATLAAPSKPAAPAAIPAASSAPAAPPATLAASSAPAAPAATPSTASPTPIPNVSLDRINFGAAASESAHDFQYGSNSAQAMGVGAFSQTYRQPLQVVYPNAPAANGERLTFTMAVDPVKQNYLTVKLFGSDTQFGVLHLLDANGDDEEVDNNASNGGGNPAFFGRFHYATTLIPLTQTQGQTRITLTLYSSGYFYNNGAGTPDAPTRPIYSAFTHVNPYFLPPATDQTGPPLTVTGYTPPGVISPSLAYGWAKSERGDIFNINPRPFINQWNPGGILYAQRGCQYLVPTPGVPPEIIGANVGCDTKTDTVPNPALIGQMNSTANPGDAWRNRTANPGAGNQVTPLHVYLGVYLLPPFEDQNGVVQSGYDDYHDPLLLQKIVGLLDALSRMQGLHGSWDPGCINNGSPQNVNANWIGLTSTPRGSGEWAGQSGRVDPGCITFEGGNTQFVADAILRLLNTDPVATAAFKVYLSQQIDANLDGNMVPRAYMYEFMMAQGVNKMGFNPVTAMTSNNAFDKAGITTDQALIFQDEAYADELALRALLALYPNPDPAVQPLDPGTMRSIIRQLIGLDTPVVMDPVGVDWRTITAAGLGESYGTLSSGYDGRYGDGIPYSVSGIVAISKYDTSLSASDRQQFATMANNTITAFDAFLYPQYGIRTQNGQTVATYSFSKEDVISYRVLYGPNADGGSDDWQSILSAADPNGNIKSSQALRSLYFASLDGLGDNPSTVTNNLADYPQLENTWLALAGINLSSYPALPAEPGQPDFAWADIQNGAVAVQAQGERLFLNANYQRPQGQVNNIVRIHHITSLVDREAIVMMPADATTVQDDGNLTGGSGGAWVVRYGRYLVVLNNSASAYTAKLPAGTGNAVALHGKTTLAMGKSGSVPAGQYEVFVMPSTP